jgi:hypothetical protein
MKTTWVSYKNTHVLLVLRDEFPVPEWVPSGYVILRQNYEGLKPRWYGMIPDLTRNYHAEAIVSISEDLDAVKGDMITELAGPKRR